MLVLHIGRGKAGSTTLQHAILLNRALLADHGILTPAGAEKSGGNYVPLSRALRENTELPGDFLELLARNPQGTILVSSEFLLTIARVKLARLAEAIAPHPAKIVVYVRDYRTWVPSLYSQATKSGKNRGDFDVYFEEARRLYALRPQLEPWISVFGAGSIMVRPLGAPLTSRGLIEDFSEILNVNLAPCDDRNISPNWVEIELLRAVYSEYRARGEAPGHGDGMAVLKTARFAMRGMEVPRVTYLTRAQRVELTELFNRDVEWLEEATGQHVVRLDAKDGEAERAFVPAFAHAPAAVRPQLLRALDQPLLRNRAALRDVLSTVASL